MTAARWVFLIAGVYGLLVLSPGFLAEAVPALGAPPVVSPEFYYGFVGSAWVWQFAFLVIASDPVRFRPLMPIAVLEKLAFFSTALVLYGLGRMEAGAPFYGAMIDGVLMIAFLWAWRVTAKPRKREWVCG